MASLYTEEWMTGPERTAFYTRKYEPPSGIAGAKAAILFLHGFVEHIGRYAHVFPIWAERGIAVLAFDQRGFGRTAEGDEKHKGTGRTRTSTEDEMDDAEWFVRRLADWAPGAKLFLVGHSMGGFNVVNFVCSPQSRAKTLPKITGVVTLSPLMGLSHPPPAFMRTSLGLVSHILPKMSVDAQVVPEHISRDPAVVKAYIDDPLVFRVGTLRAIRTMLDAVDELNATGYRSYPPSLPVLWAHGTADEVNSFTASKEMFDKIKCSNKTFTPYEGGFHELLNEPHPMKEMLMDEVATWILARCPGAEDGSKARL